MSWRCSSLAALALVVSLLLSTATFAAPPPDDGKKERASSLAKAGIALFKAKDYAEAVKVFRESFETFPIPVVAWNMARCHEELEQPEDAIFFFNKFKEIAPSDDKKAIADMRVERLLKRYFGHLTLNVDPVGADVNINGVKAGDAPLKALRLRVGTYNVEMKQPGHETMTRVIQVAPGQQFTFSFTLTLLPATVHIEAPENIQGLRVLLDDATLPIMSAPTRFKVEPGAHVVDISAGPGWAPVRQQVSLSPGEEIAFKLTRVAVPITAPGQVVVRRPPNQDVQPVKREERGGDYSGAASVVLGLGLATAGAGGVLHVVGMAQWKDVTGAERDADGVVTGITREEAVDKAESARLKYYLAYGLYGAGAAAVITSIILYATSDSPDAAPAAFAPMILRDGAGLAFGGRF